MEDGPARLWGEADTMAESSSVCLAARQSEIDQTATRNWRLDDDHGTSGTHPLELRLLSAIASGGFGLTVGMPWLR
jgi:hypothetical protein